MRCLSDVERVGFRGSFRSKGFPVFGVGLEVGLEGPKTFDVHAGELQQSPAIHASYVTFFPHEGNQPDRSLKNRISDPQTPP